MCKNQSLAPSKQADEKRKPTPTFLLEAPLRVSAGQARRLHAHLEAIRQLYNAILSRCAATVAPRAGRSWRGGSRGPFLARRSKSTSATLGRCDGAPAYPSYALHDAVKGLNC